MVPATDVDGASPAPLLQPEPWKPSKSHGPLPLLAGAAVLSFLCSVFLARATASAVTDAHVRPAAPFAAVPAAAGNPRSPALPPRHLQLRAAGESAVGFLAKAKMWLTSQMAGEYDVKAIEAEMKQFEASSPAVMYSFTTCPFCLKTKSVLDSVGAKYSVMELDRLPQGRAIQAELAKRTGRTSVPSVWVQGQFVGGCNDGGLGGVAALERDGRLVPLLRTAGALRS
eukprot:EG_transcript_19735